MADEPTDLERNEDLIAAAQIALDHELADRVVRVAERLYQELKEKGWPRSTDEQMLAILDHAVTLVINSRG